MAEKGLYLYPLHSCGFDIMFVSAVYWRTSKGQGWPNEFRTLIPVELKDSTELNGAILLYTNWGSGLKNYLTHFTDLFFSPLTKILLCCLWRSSKGRLWPLSRDLANSLFLKALQKYFLAVTSGNKWREIYNTTRDVLPFPTWLLSHLTPEASRE